MKYIIKNTAIMHKSKIYNEGETIDLTDKESKDLIQFLEPVNTKSKAISSPPAPGSIPEE